MQGVPTCGSGAWEMSQRPLRLYFEDSAPKFIAYSLCVESFVPGIEL